MDELISFIMEWEWVILAYSIIAASVILASPWRPRYGIYMALYYFAAIFTTGVNSLFKGL